jgi:hypothetical protein
LWFQLLIPSTLPCYCGMSAHAKESPVEQQRAPVLREVSRAPACKDREGA